MVFIHDTESRLPPYKPRGNNQVIFEGFDAARITRISIHSRSSLECDVSVSEAASPRRPRNATHSASLSNHRRRIQHLGLMNDIDRYWPGDGDWILIMRYSGVLTLPPLFSNNISVVLTGLGCSGLTRLYTGTLTIVINQGDETYSIPGAFFRLSSRTPVSAGTLQRRPD